MNKVPDADSPACEHCCDIEQVEPTGWYVIRTCEKCGRELRIQEPGAHGIGLKIQKGDRIHVPEIVMSLNPLESEVQFSKRGLHLLAVQVFLDGKIGTPSEYPDKALDLEKHFDAIVNESDLVKPLDVNNPDETEGIYQKLQDKQESIEYWAFLGSMCLASARKACEEGDALEASYNTAAAERCRMIVLYKQNLEEAVWMGHSVRRILNILRIWDKNRDNSDEEFWQIQLSEHSYVLSQVLAVPIIFMQEKAYVGGMKIDRKDAKLVDFLFSAESSQEAILVEIKTPTTRLLGHKYRGGVYGPSAALGGGITQTLTYKDELVRNQESITSNTGQSLSSFNPRTVLIVGNSKAELDTPEKRRSFELYRASCSVELITYDELFRKVDILATLFGLKRSTSDEAS